MSYRNIVRHTPVNTGMLVALLELVAAVPASATPNMIRLGYPTCSACHLSPQGGGLLIRYGEGIDLAQTLRPEEPRDPELGDPLGSRLNYDMRLSLGIDRDPRADAEYGFNVSLRTAFGAAQHRLVYTATVRSPTLARTRRAGAVSVGMSRLYWLYQPREGLSFVVGRDELPTGGMFGPPSFVRRVTNPDVSSTPTQAKVFWWNQRWQITGYGFGPDGNESAQRFKAYGGGAMVGANVLRDRAVLGIRAQLSRADAFDRENAGVYARVGLTKRWGFLLEHDVTGRETAAGEKFTHVAGHSELFYVPFDWLQTAIWVEHLTTRNGASTYRLSPSAEIRLTPNIKFTFDMTDLYAATDSRTFSFELEVKTQ